MRKAILKYCFCLWLLKIGILGLTLSWIHRNGLHPNFCSWDCAYYRDIATRGYSYAPGERGSMAFFPIYPWLVGTLNKFVALPFELVGTLLNLILFYVVLVLFCEWCLSISLHLWWLPPLILTIDRYTLWSQIPYTETLFWVTLLCFLLAIRSSGRYYNVVVPLLAGFASGTRLVGISLIAAFGFANIKDHLRRPWLGLSTLFLGMWGILGFFGYLQVFHGSWTLSLVTSQAWNRHYSFVGFFESLILLFSRFYFPTVPLGIAAAWFILRPPPTLKINSVERWLCFLLLYIPMANSIKQGLPRYFSVLFLGYAGLAYSIEKGFFHLRNFRWGPAVFFCLIVAIGFAELFWQVYLTRKFLLSEVFFWAA